MSITHHDIEDFYKNIFDTNNDDAYLFVQENKCNALLSSLIICGCFGIIYLL